MSLENIIGNILARYWLEENPNCGMSYSQLFARVMKVSTEITDSKLRAAINRMQDLGEVSTRHVYSEMWVYPKRQLLEPRDKLTEAEVGKYTKQLRLGGSQIELRFFDRQVLDRYRQDPRYELVESEGIGWLHIRDEYYLDPSTPESDKVLIQQFGTAYRENSRPTIAVILADLGQLSVSHQSYWSSYEIHEKSLVHPDFVKTSFDAQFADSISPFELILQELRQINRICEARRERSLFRETFKNNAPAGLSWITKPTAKDYYDLVLTVDKLLSENLNKDFFRDKIDLTVQTQLSDGKIKVQDKGTIRLLSEYLSKEYHLEPNSQIIETLRNIRKQRQTPAHVVSQNIFDPIYFYRQRKLVYDAYSAIHNLRLILTNAPSSERN